MLRPATPLAVLLFAAFVLLLLSVISTPIVKAIPLARYRGVDFGVFGYCRGSECSGVRVGYTTGTLMVQSRDLNYCCSGGSGINRKIRSTIAGWLNDYALEEIGLEVHVA